MIKLYTSILLVTLSAATPCISQCGTYIQMIDVGVEDCHLPIIVGSATILLPCSTPEGLWNLEDGEYAYIDYTPSGCSSFCQLGQTVDITCFSLITDLEDRERNSEVVLYPTIVKSNLVIEGHDIQQVEFFDMHGKLVARKSAFMSGTIDISEFAAGIYFVKVVTTTAFHVRTIMKHND